MALVRGERMFEESIADVFVALVRMLALRRWDPGAGAFRDLQLPVRGREYSHSTESLQRRGRIVEIIRPVSVTLVETLVDPPCRVVLRQRWRLHSINAGTLLRLDLEYRLNRAARLRPLHWKTQLRRHTGRMLEYVQSNLDAASPWDGRV